MGVIAFPEASVRRIAWALVHPGNLTGEAKSGYGTQASDKSWFILHVRMPALAARIRNFDCGRHCNEQDLATRGSRATTIAR